MLIPRMKRVILIFAICIFLVGVGLTVMPLSYIANSVIDSNDSDDMVANKLHIYVVSNCGVKKDAVDFWQHPVHTIIRKAGDCEDLALLEWLLFKFSGLDASLVYGTLCDRRHIWVEYQGEIWDAATIRPLGPAPIHYKPILYIRLFSF